MTDASPKSAEIPVSQRFGVAIVGGGVSGALTACQIMRHAAGTRVVILDPRPELGLGLAYSTPSMRHLLNVTAEKVSAMPDDPDHFLNWLRENYDADASTDTFAPRAIFGKYINSLVNSTSGIDHIRSQVVDCEQQLQGVVLMLDDGRRIAADYAVLATGNFDPAPLPGVSADAIDQGIYHHNAWSVSAFQHPDTKVHVSLIGTGLTSVDVLLRLRELGYRGPITAISRHGTFPNRHEGHPVLPEPVITAATPPTCLAYLREVRRAIGAGVPWRSVIDSLRSTTNDLWLALPLDEQRRFRRHLQRRWDVVRHRMAPSIADIIEAEQNAGTLQIQRGHVSAVEIAVGAGRITLKTPSGSRDYKSDLVINCTGPTMDYRKVNSPLLKKMFDRGLIIVGPHGSGLESDADGALVGANGRASNVLFTIGPSRLGRLLESIAVPEIRQQALDLAIRLTQITECAAERSINDYKRVTQC